MSYRIYLIGPTLASPGKASYDDAAIELRKRGYSVVNPFDDIETGQSKPTRIDFLKHRLKLLLDCNMVVVIRDIRGDRDAETERNLAGILQIVERKIDTLKPITDAAISSK